MRIHSGIDLVKISRIKELIKKPGFLDRTFSKIELKNTKTSHLAGLFALKEAFFKATQIEVKKWKEITVKNKENGKPYIIYDDNLVDFNISSIDCSISHDGDYAIGLVVIIEQ